MQRIDGVVQAYAWGSTTAIPALQGRSPSGGPEAELWLGAHPLAPSRLVPPTEGIADLAALIASDPVAALGADIADRFAGGLPFLMKVLAAAEPLSLQTHPSAAQAAAGFAAEEAAGVPRRAATRRYRDPHHKPELVCALTPFEALCGFRPPEEIAASLTEAGAGSWANRLRRDGLPACFAALYGSEPPAQRSLVERVAGRHPLVARLAARHPGDIGCVAALFLHHVVLEPGQALFLGPGNLHAYLEGVAVEVMANSDNVLRAGLTPKHVDVDELLRVVRCEPVALDVLTPAPDGAYASPAPEFRLRRPPLPATLHGPAIVLCTEGAATLATLDAPGGPGAAATVGIGRGEAAWVAHADGPVRITGTATVYVTEVPAGG